MSANDPDRQRRLAEALRNNLRRRKGQDRERGERGKIEESPPGKTGEDD